METSENLCLFGELRKGISGLAIVVCQLGILLMIFYIGLNIFKGVHRKKISEDMYLQEENGGK